MITRTAHAKINLALHVTGVREDGYHLLDSLVVFTEFGDRVTVSKPHHPHGPIAVSIDGPFGDGLSAGPENLVTNAAVMMREAFKRNGGDPAPVEIHLAKNLPIASGIGGGSADAAACMLALQEFWGSEVDLFSLGAVLGADVAMCLHSKPLRARGIGDDIELLTDKRPLAVVLVNPAVEVSTPNVFRQLQNKNGRPVSVDHLLDFPGADELAGMRNDLEAPAKELHPVIGEVLDALSQTSPQLVRMSGSGATCFALYDTMDLAQEAAREIKDRNSAWWCVATQTVPSG